MTFLVLIEMVFVISREMFHGRISLSSVLLLLLVNFLRVLRLELMYISLIENIRSRPHSSPWFSAECAAAIVYRNQFLRLFQKGKSSDSKVKFRQASSHSHWKRILKAAKLAYASKTKDPITSQKLGSREFW